MKPLKVCLSVCRKHEQVEGPPLQTYPNLTVCNVELQLYLIILLGQKDRHLDALALLEGDVGIKTKAIENVELRYLRIQLLIKAERWKDARDATIQILTEINSDDWRTILQYFDTIFLPTQDADLKSSESLAEARSFLSDLVKKEGKNPKRGPFLAQIELEKRVQEKIGELASRRNAISADLTGDQPC